jgi:hypothetical protein
MKDYFFCMYTRQMTLDITISDKELSTDPVIALFRVSAILCDHITRKRQGHMNQDIDMGQGVKGRIVAVDYKSITIRNAEGERRTVPLTPKRSALLAQATHKTQVQAPTTSQSSSSKRPSPRKQTHSPHPAQAGETTRK